MIATNGVQRVDFIAIVISCASVAVLHSSFDGLSRSLASEPIPPPASMRVVVDSLKSTDAKDRRQALSLASEMVTRFPNESLSILLPEISARLDDSDPEIQAIAASTLGLLGVRAKDALPKLERLLGSPDTFVGECALRSVKRIGTKSDLGTENLLRYAGSNVPSAREAVASLLSLCQSQPPSSEVKATLLRYLSDQDTGVKLASCHAIEALGIREPSHRLRLVQLLADPRCANQAGNALGTLGVGHHFDEIIAATLSDDPAVRRAAFGVLASASDVDLLRSELSKRAYSGLDDADIQVVLLASRLIRRVVPQTTERDAALLLKMATLARSPQRQVQTAAIREIGSIATPGSDAARKLADLLTDSELRGSVVQTLLRRSDLPMSIRDLMTAYVECRDPAEMERLTKKLRTEIYSTGRP